MGYGSGDGVAAGLRTVGMGSRSGVGLGFKALRVSGYGFANGFWVVGLKMDFWLGGIWMLKMIGCGFGQKSE